MEKQDFEQITGVTVTESKYMKIDEAYEAAGGFMDKETFCKSWLACGDEPLVKELVEQSKGWQESCYASDARVADLEKKMKELAVYVLGHVMNMMDGDDEANKLEMIRLIMNWKEKKES